MDTVTGDSAFTYVQQKLEAFYYKTYARLYPYRNALQILQEVLIWRRAYTTLLLYVTIHGLFVYFVQDSKLTALSLIGNEAYLLRQYNTNPNPNRLPFDKAVAEMSKPKEPQQLQSFEIFCLQIAKVWVWVDNFSLACRYWLINEPLTFAALLAVPGFILSVVGKLVPTIVIMYIAVMAVVVFPFMEFYEQRKKLVDFLDSCCPRSPHNDDINLSLDIGGDNKTQETLTAEFQQAMVPRGTKQPVAAPVTPVVASAPPLELDDSFVGTPFSSVSNLDSSLNLPSFTPQMLEQHRRNRLDPFTDSLGDLSLGADFADGGGQRPRGLARVDEAEEYAAQGGRLDGARPPPPPYYAHPDVYSNEPRSGTAPHSRHLTKKY
ncbi:hypothetical protein EMCRGX_G012523 [Ephydatia muelleri]